VRGLLDLSTMLATLNPELVPGEFVFCSLRNSTLADALHLDPIGIFTEREGLTVILTRQSAEANGIPFELSLRQITLNVHSDLAAVGLTAAIATALSDHGISANVVAGFYHDHIFVPEPDSERSVQVLKMLQNDASAQ
jgi:hypothetical protein